MDNLPVTLGVVATNQAAAGGQFNVSVHLNRDAGLAVGKTAFDLTYDPAVVSYVGMENNKSGLTVSDDGNGSVHMEYTGAVSTEAFSNYGATRLVKLTFAAKDADADAQAAFTFANVDVDAATGKKLANGKTVNIYGKSSLDLNGDGIIGAGDIALAQNDAQKKLIAAQAVIRPYKHVVMLTMDGGGVCFRPDKMYYAADGQTILTDDADIMAKRTNEYAMQLFNTYCATSYSAQSETPTISAQNYTSILHGKEYASAQNAYKIDNTKTGMYYYPDFGKTEAVYPSVFAALGQAYPNRSNAAFAEWTQIVNGIIEPDAPVYTHGSTHSGGDMQDVADYIRSDAYRNTSLVYMQSDEMDGAGHGHGYYTDYYYNTLKKFDAYFEDIMNALDETGTKDETLVLFTADHGGTIGGSHGGTIDQEYDVQIALGGQTIDSGKRLTGGTNHDPSVIALAALHAAVPASMDGTANLFEQANLNQEQLADKNRAVEKVTTTAGTNINALELTLSNAQQGRTVNTLDAVIALNGRQIQSIQTAGTVLRQQEANGMLYLTIGYSKAPDTLVRINLDGVAKGTSVAEYMLGITDGREVYGDLVNTEGTLSNNQSSGGSSSGGSSSGGSTNNGNTSNGNTSSFVDVPASEYYANAVDWAVSKDITSGTSATTFSPNTSCTRAQMVTFLWRAAGSPKVSGSNPFNDVSANAYYYDAVLWAVQNGIASGTSATTFSPDAIVTRGQTVAFLHRQAGSAAVSDSSFSDVSDDAYYANAVAWAVQKGITSGTGNDQFSPNADCTRAQIVTFLFRYLAK